MGISRISIIHITLHSIRSIIPSLRSCVIRRPVEPEGCEISWDVESEDAAMSAT